MQQALGRWDLQAAVLPDPCELGSHRRCYVLDDDAESVLARLEQRVGGRPVDARRGSVWIGAMTQEIRVRRIDGFDLGWFDVHDVLQPRRPHVAIRVRSVGPRTEVRLERNDNGAWRAREPSLVAGYFVAEWLAWTGLLATFSVTWLGLSLAVLAAVLSVGLLVVAIENRRENARRFEQATRAVASLITPHGAIYR